jgi:protein TonB
VPVRGEFAATAYAPASETVRADADDGPEPPEELPVLLDVEPPPPEPPLPEAQAAAELPPVDEPRAPDPSVPGLPRAPADRVVRAARPSAVAAPVPPPAAPAPRAAARAAPAAPSGAVVGATPLGHIRPPAYPPEARARGIGGAVVLLIEVDPAGRVASVTVAASSGHGILDEAARTAALAWTFAPARRGGVPVTARLYQTVRFDLAAAR